MTPGPSQRSRRCRSLGERIEETRELCTNALGTEPLVSVERCLARGGISGQKLSNLVASWARNEAADAELLRLRDLVNTELSVPPEACLLERAAVIRTVLDNIERIPALPIDESIGHLFCRDFTYYVKSQTTDTAPFSCTKSLFYSRLRVARLTRFPCGQSEYEVSGFPRSWLRRASARDLPRLLFFLAAKMKGFKPLFVGHLASGRRSAFLLEREFRVGFYRSALALEKQPSIKGMLAGSWLHSRETHRVSPHLAFLNRAYDEAGGFYIDLGPAPVEEGFLEGDPHRAELYRTGAYKPTFGVVMCTREQTLDWMRRNRDLEKYRIPG